MKLIKGLACAIILSVFARWALDSSAWSVMGSSIRLETVVAEGFDKPVFVIPYPGSGSRLCVVEQAGRIRFVEGGKILGPVLLDVQDKVRSGGEMGLLGLAFHPQFQKNRRYFVNYTADRPTLSTILAEYSEGKTTEKVILNIKQPYENHNGGMMAFDGAGLLYIGMGDGGYAGDPHDHAQNLQSLLGKMLRIDIDGSQPYTIPKDNPFYGDGSKRGEIFAFGLRNPWRFSFDRKTGALIAGDVGQDLWEEVSRIEKGKNLGWPQMEGKQCYKPKQNCKSSNSVSPIHIYPRSDGFSVTGGLVYRGKKIPSLVGVYLYGDYGSGRIWALTNWDKKDAKNTLLLKTNLPISSFGEETNGEVLLVSHFGGLYRLVQ